MIRDTLDTDFIDGLYPFNAFGHLISTKDYFKQLARYKHSLEEEYIYYENREDVMSMIEVKVKYDCICAFINDIRRTLKIVDMDRDWETK